MFPARLITLLAGIGAVLGCATVSGVQDRYVVCPFDAAWTAAIESLNDRPITVKDREKGLIETGWLELPSDPRSFGVFGRDIKESRDRSKMVMTVKQINDVAQLSLTEVRERWAWRGGSRMFGWAPAEPSEETIAGAMNRLNAKLRERGCSRT